MKYILIYGLTADVLKKYKLIVFTYDMEPGPYYSEVYANPVHKEALEKAGFTYIDEVGGNARFKVETASIDVLSELFTQAFGNGFVLCYEEDEVPDAEDHDEASLREAIMHIWSVNRDDWSGKPWRRDWLFSVVHCVDWELFVQTLETLIAEEKFFYPGGDHTLVSPNYVLKM